MRALLARSANAFQEVQNYAQTANRRVYRRRNLAIQVGMTNPIALRSYLRTAIPLFGAGMYRIARAHYVERLPPIELAALAQIALTTVASRAPIDYLSLLG